MVPFDVLALTVCLVSQGLMVVLSAYFTILVSYQNRMVLVTVLKILVTIKFIYMILDVSCIK